MVSKIILILDIICLIYWAVDGIITLYIPEKVSKTKYGCTLVMLLIFWIMWLADTIPGVF